MLSSCTLTHLAAPVLELRAETGPAYVHGAASPQRGTWHREAHGTVVSFPWEGCCVPGLGNVLEAGDSCPGACRHLGDCSKQLCGAVIQWELWLLTQAAQSLLLFALLQLPVPCLPFPRNPVFGASVEAAPTGLAKFCADDQCKALGLCFVSGVGSAGLVCAGPCTVPVRGEEAKNNSCCNITLVGWQSCPLPEQLRGKLVSPLVACL